MKKEKTKSKNLDKKWATVWRHYCTAIFGSQKPLGTTDWAGNLVIKSGLHVGHECVVAEHTAETIFIYASKTLDAELD